MDARSENPGEGNRKKLHLKRQGFEGAGWHIKYQYAILLELLEILFHFTMPSPCVLSDGEAGSTMREFYHRLDVNEKMHLPAAG